MCERNPCPVDIRQWFDVAFFRDQFSERAQGCQSGGPVCRVAQSFNCGFEILVGQFAVSTKLFNFPYVVGNGSFDFFVRHFYCPRTFSCNHTFIND